MALAGCCSRFTRIGLLILSALTLCLAIACASTFGFYGNKVDFTQYYLIFSEKVFTISTIIWTIVGLSTAMIIIALLLFFGMLYERKIILKIEIGEQWHLEIEIDHRPSIGSSLYPWIIQSIIALATTLTFCGRSTHSNTVPTLLSNGCRVVVFILMFHIATSIGIGAYICVQYNKDLESLDKNAINLINQYSFNTDITTLIDNVQRSLNCCGWSNESDWSHSPWLISQNTNTLITYYTPQSCCNCTVCYQQICQSNKSYRFSFSCKAMVTQQFSITFNILVGLYVPEFIISLIFFAGSAYVLTNIGREEYKYS